MKITNGSFFSSRYLYRLSVTFTRVIDPRQARLLLTKVKYAFSIKQQQCGGKTIQTQMYKGQSGKRANRIRYRCLPHKSLVKTRTVFYICGSLLDLRLSFSPLKATVVAELCQAKPTYSCHESLQGYVVTETGANLQARNTFKVLPWPDSAKSLEPVK